MEKAKIGGAPMGTMMSIKGESPVSTAAAQGGDNEHGLNYSDARSRIKASRTSTSGCYRLPRRAVIFVSNPSVRIGISGVWNGFFITASA